MWDELLELVLNLALGLLEGLSEFVDWPRFYTCLVLSLIGASLNERMVTPPKVAHFASVLLVVIGLGTGILWECSGQ